MQFSHCAQYCAQYCTVYPDLKDVRAKIFLSLDFFLFSLPADNELPVPEMPKKKGGHRLRFRDKACGKLY